MIDVTDMTDGWTCRHDGQIWRSWWMDIDVMDGCDSGRDGQMWRTDMKDRHDRRTWWTWQTWQTWQMWQTWQTWWAWQTNVKVDLVDICSQALISIYLSIYQSISSSNGNRSSKFFDLLPQLKDGEWFSCCPRCFVSYQNLPEVWYPNVFHSLICFSKVLSEEMLHELSTYLVCYHSSSKNRVISPDPSSEGIVSQWM